MVPNEKANERQSASLTPSDWSFFARQGSPGKSNFLCAWFLFYVYSLVPSYVRKITIFFAVFLPLFESIIYSRYNAWIGRILSAWAPRLWQGLEREWKLFSRRNEFWGFEYVSGFLISGGGKALLWKKTDIRNVSHFGNKWEKSTNWTFTTNKAGKGLHLTLLHLCLTSCHITATRSCKWDSAGARDDRPNVPIKIPAFFLKLVASKRQNIVED